MSLEAIWGRRTIHEALRAGRRRIHEIYVAEGVKDREISEILELCASSGVSAQYIRRSIMDERAPDSVHQGVVGMFDPYPYASIPEMLSLASARGEDPLLILAAHIEDPHNLGSILRTAECAGAHGIILPKRRSASVTPAVVRVSAGASEHLRVARVTNLVRTVEELKEERLWVFGAEVGGVSLYDANLAGGLVLCVGAEGVGLPRLLRETCDELIEIPLRGRVESLNVGVAAGVVVYEAIRRRMSEPGTHG